MCRRMLLCVNLPTDEELITNMLAPMESTDDQGFIPFIKKHHRRPPSQMPRSSHHVITRSIVRS